REAVVLAVDGATGKQLVGYLIPQQAGEDEAALRQAVREQLKASLPDYMVPAHLVCLSAWPLTGNGKLDRKALPQPDAGQLQQAYVAPVSALEQQVAAIWADVLQVERVGLGDDFFELGGHSLLVLSVLSRLQLSLGLKTEPAVLFQNPVLGAFIEHLDKGNDVAFEDKLKRLDLLFAEDLEDAQ
nr:peptide synthase [Pseudomonas putida]HDS0993864.1 peptide synthase [Pseudomonas putida]